MARFLTDKDDTRTYDLAVPIEEGIYVEPEPAKVRLRDRWEAAENAAYHDKIERQVEEARWAARSGPCVIIRPPSGA